MMVPLISDLAMIFMVCIPIYDNKNSLYTTYRIGNGSEGNVGSNTITRILQQKIRSVWNQESVESLGRSWWVPIEKKLETIRQNVPEAFRIQERAVTESDYVEILKRHRDVQSAPVFFRWTGTRYTVCVSIDPFGDMEVNEEFKKEILEFLDKYRLAGYHVRSERIPTCH